LVGSAAVPPPTSKNVSEADWTLSLSCASASDSNLLVELDASERRLGRDKSPPAELKQNITSMMSNHSQHKHGRAYRLTSN